jgi:hypothetical protein
MNSQQAIAALFSNAEKFLHTNPFNIGGSGTTANAVAGEANFKMEIKASGGFSANFVDQGPAYANLDYFRAWYIPMQQLHNFTVDWLPTANDSPLNLMLTSQITGCLFGVGSKKGRTCVAHIQPDANTHTSDDLDWKEKLAARQKDLRHAAKKAKLTRRVALDKTFTQLHYVAVVGSRDDKDKWRIYAQNVDSLPKTIDGVLKV